MGLLPKYIAPTPTVSNTSILCAKTVLYAFFIPVPEANFATLQTLCKNTFDVPTGGKLKCVPMDPVVMLLVDQVGWIGSTTSTIGGMQVEALLQVPVTITSAAGSFNALYTPWIWVDNPISLMGGREIFGYPKSWGAFGGFPAMTPPTTLAGIPAPNPLGIGALPPAFTMSAYGANNTDIFWAFHPLFQIVPEYLNPWSPAGLQALIAGLNLQPATLNLINLWSTNGLKQVFLKQFPDIKNGQDACLQQITSVDYNITQLYSTVPFGYPISLRIFPLNSHDVCANLGIAASQTLTGGIQLIMDFTVSGGTVLWP